MTREAIEIAASAGDSSPITETMESNSLLTRREMLGLITSMAGLAALTGIGAQCCRETAHTPQITASYRLSRQLLGFSDSMPTGS